MSKYIKMNKALDELKLAYDDIVYIDKRETAEQILKLPSINIVHCGECNRWEDGRVDFSNCELMGIVKPDDFCSYGERKEGE